MSTGTEMAVAKTIKLVDNARPSCCQISQCG